MHRTFDLPSLGEISGSASRGRLRSLLAHALDRLLLWQERHRQRYALEMLDDRLLEDIGLSRADVHREATKRFWQD
jgi:uncharacterized protein YjiS (DUF1127 family)